MAVSPRIIRRRIKSVANTRKITRAMELVAAAKMRRAVAASQRSRSYAALARDMLTHLAHLVQPDAHPLLTVTPTERVLLVVVTSHRGLCGGFNANILRRAVAVWRAPEKLSDGKAPVIDVAAVGRKGEEAFRRVGADVVASFRIAGDTPTAAEARPIAQFAQREFLSGKYQKVVIAYTEFVSSLVQAPRFVQLLPVSAADVESLLTGREAPRHAELSEALFEPDPGTVLEAMLPRLVEALAFQTLLESSASEHSARMFAMRSATDAAGEMIDGLTLTYNGARQAGITREIAEIAAGSAAQE